MTLLVIVLIAAPLAKDVPLAAPAAILMSVAIDIGEWEVFASFRSYGFARNLKLFSVFFVTVIFDLTVAVELGMLLSALVLIAHIAEVTQIKRLESKRVGIAHYSAFGSLFFGATEKLETLLERAEDDRVVMLDLSHVIYMDTTAPTGRFREEDRSGGGSRGHPSAVQAPAGLKLPGQTCRACRRNAAGSGFRKHAGVLPARRASAVDPMTALRCK